MEALKGKKLTKNSKSQDKYNKKSGITPTLLAKLNIKNEFYYIVFDGFKVVEFDSFRLTLH